MADSTGLFIVLMIFCFMSIISSILLTYTCTDGTWDFDNFEGEQCVKFPEEDKTDPACSTFTTQSDCPSRCSWDTTSSSCGEPVTCNTFTTESGCPAGCSWDSVNSTCSDYVPSGSQFNMYTSNITGLYIEKSDHFEECSVLFDIDQSVSCYNKNNNGAAVRWFFTESGTISATCKNYIQKIRVFVTSSQPGIDNNQWWYTDLSSSVADFYFKDAPTGFVTTANGGGTRKITFVIQALDKDDKLVSPEIFEELIPESNAEDCSNLGVGTGTAWDDIMIKYSLPSPESQTPAELIPKDCEGGVWILDQDYGCQINGEKVVKSDCGPNCFERYYLGGDNYVPAENGGTCIVEKIEEYGRDGCEGQEATVYNQACVLGENWLATARSEIDKYPVTKTNQYVSGGYCSKEYKENADDIAGTQLQIKQRLQEPQGKDESGNEYVCGPEQREVECNNFLKPIEGVCGWTDVGAPTYTNNCNTNPCCNMSGTQKKWKQKQVYNITTMHQGDVAENKKCTNNQGDERDHEYSSGSCSSGGGAACMWATC